MDSIGSFLIKVKRFSKSVRLVVTGHKNSCNSKSWQEVPEIENNLSGISFYWLKLIGYALFIIFWWKNRDCSRGNCILIFFWRIQHFGQEKSNEWKAELMNPFLHHGFDWTKIFQWNIDDSVPEFHVLKIFLITIPYIWSMIWNWRLIVKWLDSIFKPFNKISVCLMNFWWSNAFVRTSAGLSVPWMKTNDTMRELIW
jgi:hypothetical protein